MALGSIGSNLGTGDDRGDREGICDQSAAMGDRGRVRGDGLAGTVDPAGGNDVPTNGSIGLVDRGWRSFHDRGGGVYHKEDGLCSGSIWISRSMARLCDTGKSEPLHWRIGVRSACPEG